MQHLEDDLYPQHWEVQLISSVPECSVVALDQRS